MRSARSYAQEAARLHAGGATYGQIVTTWARQHQMSPLTAARMVHGLTQRQVAERWNQLWPDPERPKTAKTISYWETGDRQPSRDSLNKLAFLYRCSAGVLLDGEDYTHLDPAVHEGAGSVQLLSVSLAVVVRAQEVLLVCRRDNTEGVFWGWPTGVVKPGRDPANVAVSETLAETGVHCTVRAALGTRIHPKTGALCAYFLADHLAGEPENRDPVENVAVSWVPVHRLTDFVPAGVVYPPILEALGVAVSEQPTIVAVIITSAQGVLLARRHDGKPEWTFPAGAQERGEIYAQTAVRETMEETGLKVVTGRVLGERTHPRTGRHMVYLAAEPISGTAVRVGDPQELAEVGWYTWETAESMLPQLFEPVAEHLRTVLSCD
ncbi:MAG: NUDIX domain-containing protein [Pseudonocardiaceae bacterium]